MTFWKVERHVDSCHGGDADAAPWTVGAANEIANPDDLQTQGGCSSASGTGASHIAQRRSDVRGLRLHLRASHPRLAGRTFGLHELPLRRCRVRNAHSPRPVVHGLHVRPTDRRQRSSRPRSTLRHVGTFGSPEFGSSVRANSGRSSPPSRPPSPSSPRC